MLLHLHASVLGHVISLSLTPELPSRLDPFPKDWFLCGKVSVPLLCGFCLQSGGTGLPGGTELGYSGLWHGGGEGLLCSGGVWFPCEFSLWGCLPLQGELLGGAQVGPLM